MQTINIGLDNPVTGKQNTIDQTIGVAIRYLKGISDIAVAKDGGEVTLVVTYFEPVGSLTVLCAELDQDCVAVFNHDINKGTLIGPKASEWGAFDIDKFFNFQ
jgi:hypothetical protein